MIRTLGEGGMLIDRSHKPSSLPVCISCTLNKLSQQRKYFIAVLYFCHSVRQLKPIYILYYKPKGFFYSNFLVVCYIILSKDILDRHKIKFAKMPASKF